MELKHLNILSVDMELDTAKEVINHTFMYDNETVDAAFRRLFIESIDKELDDETAELSKLQPSSDYRDEKQEKRYDELRMSQARAAITRDTPSGGSVAKEIFATANTYITEATSSESDTADTDKSDTYDGPDEIKDSATAEKNYDALKAALDALEEKDEEGNPKWMAVIKEYSDKVDFINEEDKNVDEEQRKIALEALWRTTKTNILVAHTLEWEWMKNFNDPSADKEALIKDEVEDYYAFNLMKAREAEKIREPEGAENEVGTEEYIKYMQEVSKNSLETLKEFFADKKEKIKIRIDKIVAAAADAKVKIDDLANHLDIKGYAKTLSDKVRKHAGEFDSWMGSNYPKIWGTFKKVAENFRANKAQFAANTLATLAYGTVSAVAVAHGNAALLAVATKAYASYVAAGSAVFPIIQKRHDEREKARKAKEDISKWKGLKGLKNAVKSIFSNSRDAIGYCAKVGFGCLAAGITCGIANSSIAKLGVDTALTNTANVTKLALASKAMRFKSCVVRSITPVMAQAATFITDGIKYKVNKSEENKAYYEQSKKGLKWGAILAGGSVLLQSLVAPVHAGNANVVENIPTTGNAGNGHATLDEVLNSGRNNNSAAIAAITSGKGAAAVEAVASDNGVAAVADTAKPDTLLGRIFSKFVGKAQADSLSVDSAAADSAAIAGGNTNIEDIDLNKELGLEDAQGGDGAQALAETTQAFVAPEVPTEYNEAMGITEAHWNELKRDITGIYARHADIFGLENKSPEESFATMYTNVEFAKHVNPDLFKDLSHVDTNVLQDMLQDEESAALLEKALGMSAEKIGDMAQNDPDALQQSFANILLNQNEDKADALNDLFNNNPDLFDKQMTTEDVLYKYLKVIEQSEKTKNGPKGFLITRLDKEGYPMFSTRHDETSALNSIILCGHPDGYDDFEGALSADLHRIAANGKITGEGAGIGETNNYFAGARGDGSDCTDTYQNAWHKGATEQPAQRPDGTASGGVWTDNINQNDGSAANGEVESNVMGGYSKDRRAGSLGVGTKTSKPVTISHDGGR